MVRSKTWKERGAAGADVARRRRAAVLRRWRTGGRISRVQCAEGRKGEGLVCSAQAQARACVGVG